MDSIKTLAIATTVALIVLVGFMLMLPKQDNLGGVPGVAVSPFSVTTLTQGGGIYATSTLANSTLYAGDIAANNVVDMTLTQTSGTLTLPATSTMTNIVPNPGDTRTLWVRNASTSAAVNLTIAAGTGMTFKNAASSTVLLIGDTDGDNAMKIILVRKADNDINVYLQKFQD